MKQKGLGKLYDRLTPEERFKLDVEAMARGDTEESRRLVDTCPRRTYTMNEPRFTWRWDGAIHLTMAMLMDLRQNTGRLRMIDAFRMTLPHLQGLRENDTHHAILRAISREVGTHGRRPVRPGSLRGGRRTMRRQSRTETPK
jgi:hypothetical protein